MQPTVRDYIIAFIGLAPVCVAFVFRDPISASLNIAPKLVFGAALLMSVAVTLGLAVARVRRLPSNQTSVSPWVRIAAASILAMAVTYFFMREEIAAALNVRLRAGDGIAVLLFVVASIWLAGQVSSVSAVDDAGEDEPLR